MTTTNNNPASSISPPAPGEVWDRLLESALTRARSQPSRPGRFGLERLRLNPEPTARHLPRLERSLAGIDPTLRRALRGLVAGELPWPLFLHGTPGTGKTSALLCLLDHAGGEYHTMRGLHALLIRAEQGRLEWYDRGRGGNLWPEQVWDRIGKAPLVVLDDVGCRERVSDLHYETVKQVLEERAGRPLAVLSNLNLAGIVEIYDDRIFSRLSAGSVVELVGRDRRIQP